MSASPTSNLPEIGVSSFPAIIIGGVALILFVTYHVFIRGGKKCPPGPIGLPFLGSILSLFFAKRPPHEIITDWSHKYGPIFTFNMFGTKVVVLSDKELIRDAFHRTHDVNGRISTSLADRKTGRPNNGIVASDGGTWREQRRFFLTVLKKIDSTVISSEDLVASQALRFINEVRKKHGASFNPITMINMTIANVISRVITGNIYDYDDTYFQRVIECSNRLVHCMGPAGLYGLVPILSKIPSSTLTKATRLTQEITETLSEMIETHKAEFDPGRDPEDFISFYLHEMHRRKKENNQGSFDDINFLATLFDVLLGGWETLGATMPWIVFTIASHPEAQRRIRREIIDVVGTDRFPRFSDRHSMPITEATLAECMRLHPAEAFHTAHFVSRDCKIGGYDISKGAAVVSNLWYLALSPTIWEDPEGFNPERFLDSEGNFNRKLEPFPFGFGLRVCPGEVLSRMEIFLFITYLIQRFELTLPEGDPKSIDGHFGLTNKPTAFKIHAKKICSKTVCNNNLIL